MDPLISPKASIDKQTTRKYFGTDGIRGRVGVWPITAEFILKLGWSIGRVFVQQGSGQNSLMNKGEQTPKVLIGKDTRISGYMFESVLEAGLSAAGVDTHLLGPMPTPAIAYLTRTLRAQAGIVISASHNPYYDNGIKFFSSQGKKLPDEIELAIEEQLEKSMTTVDSACLGKAIRVVDAPGRYIEFCKSTVASDINLNGLKIVVDCANGAAYHIAPNVFRELGADVIEIGVDPDGLNINLECGATHPALLQRCVLKEKAHVGVALDGDGDRVIMVDHEGHILDGDELLYIIARHRLEQGSLKGGIVGTVMTNIGLEHALSHLNVPFIRVPVGDRHVMTELAKQNWVLGGEPSGHIICSESITTGDGIITALQVLSAMRSQSLSLAELTLGLKKLPQVLVNVEVSDTFEVDQNKKIQAFLVKIKQELAETGRVLLRRSGTEPVIRIMVEGENGSRVKELAHELAALLKEES